MPHAPTDKPEMAMEPTVVKRVAVAIAIIFREGNGGRSELLICRRRMDSVLAGYWEFPGGKMNMGESPAACAVRETEEETGLTVEVVEDLAMIEHEYPHASVSLYPHICRYVEGSLELRQVAEAVWIVPKEVGRYQFPEANVELIKGIEAGRVRIGPRQRRNR
jgi:mutator protein MutT